MCDSFEGAFNTNIIFTKRITDNIDSETKRLKKRVRVKTHNQAPRLYP